MSLGRVGLVGSLGKKTNANIVFWANDVINFGFAGVSDVTFAGTANLNASDDRFNLVMPYSGKFLQLLTFQQSPNNGLFTLTLMKNNIATALLIDNSSDPAILDTPIKTTVSIPFIQGDLFKLRFNVNRTDSSNLFGYTLLGGFDVP